MPAPGAAIQESLIISRALPIAIQDQNTNPGASRGDRFGGKHVSVGLQGQWAAADEGVLFVASMTPGQTALQLGLSASYSGTAAAFMLINTDSPQNPNARRIFPKKLRMVVSGAPTSATNWVFSTQIDNVNRQPTNVTGGSGVAISAATATAYSPAANNTNMGIANKAVGVPYFPVSIAAGAPPAIPAPSPAARTLVGNGILRSQIPVVGDEYDIVFGAIDDIGSMMMTAAPAGYSRITFPHEALAIDPGQSLIVYMWGTSNATAGIIFNDVTMSWLER
jgi:hypothetical protein